MTSAVAGLPGGRVRALLRPPISALIGLLARRRLLDAGEARPLRVLILTYEPELGSVMAMTPLLGALRNMQPTAHITVMGTPLLAESLYNNPNIDGLAGTAYPCRSLPSTLWNCLRALSLRGARFDWIVTTEGNRHHVRTGLLVACLPARRRAGFAASTVLKHYDHPVSFDPDVSAIINNLRTLAPLGVVASDREPEMFFDAAAFRRVRDRLAATGIDETRPLAVIACQTSGRQPVSWLADRMAQVALRLFTARGLQPLFVGTADGHEVISEVLGHMSVPGVSLAGRTTIPELAALCALADLTVTLDTGALHVARGVRTPVVVVASGWQGPQHWLPRGIEHCVVLSKPDLCRPACRSGNCPSRACMAAISTDEVVAAAEDLLDRYPPIIGREKRIAACLSKAAPSADIPQSFWAAFSEIDSAGPTHGR
jgi:ADP-heptose:LPS heptosyltransferase